MDNVKSTWRDRLNWKNWRELFAFTLMVIVAYKLINNFEPIMLFIRNFLITIAPFLTGLLIAYFLNPPCGMIRRKLLKSKSKIIIKRSNGISIIIVYLISTIIFILALNYLLPLIIKSVIDFIGLVPFYYKTLNEYILSIGDDNFLLSLVDWESISNMLSIQSLISNLSAWVGSISELALGMTSGLFNMVLSIIISVYMLLHKDSLLALAVRLINLIFNEKNTKIIMPYFGKTNEIFYKFITTQILDMCILGTLATFLLLLTGSRYAIALGVLLGVCNMIPYFGSIFASSVAFIVTIFSNDLSTALILGVSLVTLQQIDGNIICPRLLGNSLKINPIWIILSITIGGSYFGIIGMFLSVPIAALIKFIFNNSIEVYEENRRYKSSLNK